MNRAELLDLLTTAASCTLGQPNLTTRGEITDYLLTYKVIRDALDAVGGEN